MGFGSKFSEQLGEGAGKGINWTIAKTVGGLLALGGAFLVWYFAWKRDGKSFLRDNSFRIAVTAGFIAFLTVPDLVRFSFTHPDEEHAGKVSVTVQFASSSSLPSMPNREFFKPVAYGEADSFAGDGMTYVRYKERPDGAIPHAVAWSRYCIMVAAGEKIVIHSDTPPTAVMNMREKVKFPPRFERLSDMGKFLYRNNLAFFGEGRILDRTFEELATDWSMADIGAQGKGFIATAAKASKIPYPHAGGMVCF